MPVCTRVTSLSSCAQTVGNPVTAVAPAIAAPPFSTPRRDTLLVRIPPAFFISLLPLLAFATLSLRRLFQLLRTIPRPRPRAGDRPILQPSCTSSDAPFPD